MIVGTLNKDLKGKISTLDASFYVKLLENTKGTKENSPTHTVMAQNSFGDIIQVGSAWERKINKGEKAGSNMYSMVIDDPKFNSPLNVSAFPSSDGFNIVFERQEKESGF